MKSNACLVLSPATSQAKFIAVAQNMKSGALLGLFSATPQAKLIAVAQNMKSGALLAFPPDTPQVKLIAVAQNMKPGALLDLRTTMDQEKLIAVLAQANGNLKVLLPNELDETIRAIVGCQQAATVRLFKEVESDSKTLRKFEKRKRESNKKSQVLDKRDNDRKDLPLKKRRIKNHARVGRLTLLGGSVGNHNPPTTQTSAEKLKALGPG